MKRSAITRKPTKAKTPKQRVPKARILPEDEIVDGLAAIFKAPRSDASQAVRTAMSRGASLDDMKAALKTTLDRHSVRAFDKPVGFFVTEAGNIAKGNPSPPLEAKDDPLEIAASWKGLTRGGGWKPIGAMISPKIEEVAAVAKEKIAAAPKEDEPRCQKCDDAGYVRKKTTDRSDPEFGKVFPCGCKSETLAERREKARAWSGLTELQMGMRLKGTELLTGVKEAIEICEAFIKGDISQIVFQSPPGCGKTRLAVATLMEHLDKGVLGLYVNVARYLQELRNTYERATAETYMEIAKPAMQWPVVVLDDLGGEKKSPWTEQTLYEIIDARYQAGLKTIACTNQDPYKMDERIVSRLCDVTRGVVYTFPKETKDYRLTGGRN